MDELSISDLYALAALRSEGIEPIRTVGDGRRAAWIFAESPDLREALEDFYGRRLTVDALSFSEQVRSAKGEAMNLRAVHT